MAEVLFVGKYSRQALSRTLFVFLFLFVESILFQLLYHAVHVVCV